MLQELHILVVVYIFPTQMVVSLIVLCPPPVAAALGGYMEDYRPLTIEPLLAYSIGLVK
jgi:hypothetical protein